MVKGTALQRQAMSNSQCIILCVTLGKLPNSLCVSFSSFVKELVKNRLYLLSGMWELNGYVEPSPDTEYIW